ncbi:MAG TPA: DUF2752 domain-containing protein [Ignavibacteriaceae bacterium]|nr:DUF2752 domain-containing protein [Ignavibacteriaceae bacterium]
MIKKALRLSRFINIEAAAWICGLIFLIILPAGSESHFTLCPFKNLGISFCPGCGLGRSIHYLFILDFKSSFAAHPLGPFALIIITGRIISLIKKNYIYNHLLNNN